MKNKIIYFLSRTKIGRLILFSFSETFDEEFKESLLAKKIYHEYTFQKSNIFLLRRNIHRLEKGLSSKKMKDVFGLGYIKQTVSNLIGFVNDEELNKKYSEDIEWGKQVITKYFYSVKMNSMLKVLKQEFDDSIKTISKNNLNLVPYTFEKIAKIPIISYEQYQAVVYKRRSVRYYKNIAVENEKIEKALQLAKFSPTPCNRYSVRYHCMSDKKLITKVGSIVGGARSFIDNVPKLVAVTSLSSAFEGLYDRHGIYIDGSLSIMTFIYALETMGLSSCVINWPRVPKNDKEVKKYLNLQETESVIMLLSIGYADMEGYIPYSQKKSNKNLIKYYD
jgi:nitroreductase